MKGHLGQPVANLRQKSLPALTDGWPLRLWFRGSIRAVGCLSVIIDAIGTWITADIGPRYGRVYNLIVKH